MSSYAEEEWYQREKENYLQQYGDVPPHWVVFPDSHPYSIGWRMGAGETFCMVFSEWFEATLSTENERITYFRKYPPPPRWLMHVADAIWDLESTHIDWFDETFDVKPYLKKLAELGFSGTENYEQDLEDEKWL